MARIGNLLLKLAVVGQQQQTLRVVIQTPGDAKTRRLQIVRECSPLGAGSHMLPVTELAQHLERLIEEN